MARGGQRLERVRDRRSRAAKVRAVRVGGPVVFKKHWVVGRSSIETTLAVLRFRNRLVIEAWLGARLRQRRGRENGDRDGQPSAQHKTRCGSHQTLPLPPTVAALRRGATETTRRGRCSISAFSPCGLSAGDANVVAADVGRVASTARWASEAEGLQTTHPNVNPAHR